MHSNSQIAPMQDRLAAVWVSLIGETEATSNNKW
jgi:hypothetical protein